MRFPGWWCALYKKNTGERIAWEYIMITTKIYSVLIHYSLWQPLCIKSKVSSILDMMSLRGLWLSRKTPSLAAPGRYMSVQLRRASWFGDQNLRIMKIKTTNIYHLPHAWYCSKHFLYIAHLIFTTYIWGWRY